MLLFCTPSSVGWLRWLFSFLSVHRSRLLLFSFIFGPSLRCVASVVCLGSLSATSLSLPFSVSVPLLSPGNVCWVEGAWADEPLTADYLPIEGLYVHFCD